MAIILRGEEAGGEELAGIVAEAAGFEGTRCRNLFDSLCVCAWVCVCVCVCVCVGVDLNG